ncbi:MAG TPA: MFS transporter [Candidatus Dormibacteraeota bacterium]|nr:MFS transporter [Candidatus Dormibacteraeota bacterium]
MTSQVEPDSSSTSETPRRNSRALLLAVAGAGLFIAAMDAYVVVTLLPAMIADVGLTIDRIEQATPLVSGFLGGYIVAMPLLGAYSDVRGRAPIYIACLAAFALGSVVTATAGLWNSGLAWLVVGRVLQGLGGGGLVPLTLAIAADLYRGGGRTVALGSVAGLQEAGSVFGPLYGATLAAAAASAGGWRFVFWLNVPLAAACGAGLYVLDRRLTPRVAKVSVTVRVREGAPSGHRRDSIDWLSALLLGGGLGLLVLALYPDDPANRATGALFIPAGIASLVLLVIYGWRQLRQLEPLIPRALLRSRRFIGSTAANLLIGAALMVALVDVPLLGRLVFGLDELNSGLLLTRFLVGVPVGAVLGGLAARRFSAWVTALAGIALAAVAFLQMSGWPANELDLRLGPLRQADIALAACGVGFGIVIAPLAAAVLDLTRAENHGLASSLVVLARTLGMLIGLSTLTAFGLHRFHQILGTPQLDDPTVKERVDHLARLVAAAFLQEYREIFGIAAVLCVLAGVVIVVTLGPLPYRFSATASK